MRVFAVVLNYRTPAVTVRAVEALGRSAHRIDSVVVVDNGSGDGSEAYLRSRLGDITVLQTGANLGFPAGCNAGVRHALASEADAVLFLNSDAIVAPGCVGDLCRALEAQPQAGIAGPTIVGGRGLVESAGLSYSARTGRMRLRCHGERPAPAHAARIRAVDAVSAAVMLVRRSVFERIGLFAEEFFYSFEDLDFCLRARHAGFGVIVVERALASHEGSASIGRTSARRLYFGARNHLLLAARNGRGKAPHRAARLASIVLLNLAHAALRADAGVAGVRAVLRGTRDHLAGKYGADA